jgi:regulator of protease activity HflC (stomatin/prohibitin superfamily)
MLFFHRIKIRSFEVGLYFRDGEFQKLLPPGTNHLLGSAWKIRVDVVSRRDPWLRHDQLDVLIKSGALRGQAEIIDLLDHQRAIVWIDGRFHRILPPGQYAYWNGFRKVHVEVIDARDGRLQHRELTTIARMPQAIEQLNICAVERGHDGVLFVDGKYVETLPAGQYAFWRQAADAKVVCVDTREQALDVSGQEIMTSDKVTLRMNAVVTFRIIDACRALMATDGFAQSLYREAQLALRAVVGTRDLDALLADKDALTDEFKQRVCQRARELGLEIVSAGLRDVILPGDMKDLMNKVTEAQKAAEANLIVRREETAAMRSQANTAKLLADNPTLMRLRELEVLEKVAANGKLNIVMGEKGLTDRVVNLL